MPGMNGYALADTLREEHPTLKYVYMSGFAAYAGSGHQARNAGEHFIAKPFTHWALAHKAHKVREVLDGA